MVSATPSGHGRARAFAALTLILAASACDSAKSTSPTEDRLSIPIEGGSAVEAAVTSTSGGAAWGSCAAAALVAPGAPDGDYVVLPSTGPAAGKAFAVRCADMATPAPRTFFVLAQTGGLNNFSEGNHVSMGATFWTTWYTALRIDPATLLVNVGDTRFSTSQNGAVSYAAASSCRASRVGRGNINLVGTPFAVNSTFQMAGAPVAGVVGTTVLPPQQGLRQVAIVNQQVVPLEAVGNCGGVTAGADFHNTYNANQGFVLQLSYVGASLDASAPVVTPQITGSTNEAGEHTSAVDIAWTYSAPSGIFSAQGCGPVRIERDGGSHSRTCTVRNRAGVPTSVVVNFTFPPPDQPTTTTVAFAAETAVYTGSAFAATASVNPAAAGSATIAYSGDCVNVGTGCTATASFAGAPGHLPSTATATLTITRAPSSTAVSCPASVTFTGSALTPCSATVTAPGLVNGTATVVYTDNTDAGTASASASYAGDANLLPSAGSKTFSIDQAPTATSVSFGSGPFVFTGDAFTASASVAPAAAGAATIAYSGDCTNAGTSCTATATFAGGGGYAGSTASTSITIDKAASTTTVSCPVSVTYTAGAVVPCSTVLAGPAFSATAVPVHSNNVNAGTASASYTFTGTANLLPSGDSQGFTIKPAATVTTVSCSSATYTDAPLTPCSATVTGPGLSTTVTVTYANNTDAGTASGSASFAGNGNLLASSDIQTFVIGKAATTTAITCSNATYTGSAHTPCSATVAGPGLSTTAPVSYTSNTNAGTAAASASFGGSANLQASSDAATFAIARAATTTTVSCPVSLVYTAAALTPCTTSVTGPAFSESPAPTHTSNTNVGTATASYTFGGTSNLLTSNDSQSFAIKRAATTTTVSCFNVTYTGTALTPCSATVTGPGFNAALPVAYTSNTNAGSAAASATFAGSANLLGSTDGGAFTIARAATATTVTFGAGPFIRTGSAFTATAAVNPSAAGTASIAYSGDCINAGSSCTGRATFAGNNNYVPSTATTSITIKLPVATTDEMCKKGGWVYATDDLGNVFKNQGDCVSFVATRGKNKGAGGA